MVEAWKEPFFKDKNNHEPENQEKAKDTESGAGTGKIPVQGAEQSGIPTKTSPIQETPGNKDAVKTSPTLA